MGELKRSSTKLLIILLLHRSLWAAIFHCFTSLKILLCLLLSPCKIYSFVFFHWPTSSDISRRTRIRVHCSEVQTMRSEAVYFPPEGTHGWSHPMTNTDLYWSQCRQGPLTWSYRDESFVFVCRHENVKKKRKSQHLPEWNSLNDISVLWIPRWQLLTGRRPFVFASLTRIQVEQTQTKEEGLMNEYA